MACILCNFHGQQFMAFVSPRIATAVLANESLKNVGEIQEIVIHSPIANKTRHLVDSGFVVELTEKGLLPAETREVLSEDDSWEIEAMLQPVCVVCFREWARAQGFE